MAQPISFLPRLIIISCLILIDSLKNLAGEERMNSLLPGMRDHAGGERLASSSEFIRCLE